jgi:hypothetical protein
MKQETGGPAFPVAYWNNDKMAYLDTGATLRDYFAAKAMQSLINRDKFAVGMGCEHWTEQCAEQAYSMAGAMLRARR